MSISSTRNSNVLKLFCDLCFLTIENEPVIQCIECNIDICVHCFHDMIEVRQHSRYHEYRVLEISCKNELDWSILEQLIFHNGLAQYGIGNWEGISKSIGSKNEQEVEFYFYNSFCINKNVIKKENYETCTSNPFRSKISIYMNHRQDFDIEYMNNHEEYIRDIEINENTSNIEKKAKMTILKGYDVILQMRKHRNKTLIDKYIINIDKQKEMDQKYAKYLDINKYKWLLEYLPADQFYKFIEGIYIENMLKAKKNAKEQHIDYGYILSNDERKFANELGITYEEYCSCKEQYINHVYVNMYHKDTFYYDMDEGNFAKVVSFLNDQNYFI